MVGVSSAEKEGVMTPDIVPVHWLTGVLTLRLYW